MSGYHTPSMIALLMVAINVRQTHLRDTEQENYVRVAINCTDRRTRDCQGFNLLLLSKDVQLKASNYTGRIKFLSNPTLQLDRRNCVPANLVLPLSFSVTFSISENMQRSNWTLLHLQSSGLTVLKIEMNGLEKKLIISSQISRNLRSPVAIRDLSQLWDGNWHGLSIILTGSRLEITMDCDEKNVLKIPISPTRDLLVPSLNDVCILVDNERRASDNLRLDVSEFRLFCSLKCAMEKCPYRDFSSSMANHRSYVPPAYAHTVRSSEKLCTCEKGEKGMKGEPGPQGLPGIPASASHYFNLDNGDFHTGSKGEKGDKGPMGTPGLKGSKGSKGERGTFGLPGTQGERGARGIQGPEGKRGLMGPTGFPGEPGRRGAVGPAGPRGAPGDCKRVKGEPGARGPKGDRGPRGLPGKNGLNGAPGDQGVPGSYGPPGLPGHDGPPGPEGKQGPRGPPGMPGSQGAPGPRVAREELERIILSILEAKMSELSVKFKGEQGPPGLTIRGPVGEPGPQGLPGEPGQPGLTGEIGFPGLPGIPGIDGLRGPRGPPGRKGERGAKGECVQT